LSLAILGVSTTGGQAGIEESFVHRESRLGLPPLTIE